MTSSKTLSVLSLNLWHDAGPYTERAKSLREWIDRLDPDLIGFQEALRGRGFKSPYLRNYVVARINPVRFHRAKKGDTKPAMAVGAALTRMASSAKKFDVAKVKDSEIALVAAVSD